jgi:hypothetical protein
VCGWEVGWEVCNVASGCHFIAIMQDSPSVPGQQEKRVKVVKFKGKRAMRQGLQSQEAQQYAQQRQQNGFTMLQEANEGPQEDLVEQIEFDARLKSLAAKSQRQAAPAAAPRDNISIYADVQPLSQTLLPRDDSAAGKEYDSAQFGPSQAALAAAALLLGGIFLLTSGGGDLPPPRPQAQLTSPAGSQKLSDEARRELEEQLAGYEVRVDGDGSDLDALEAAAVLNAQLGRYARAEGQLARLKAGKPGDVEVLRVLAEVQAAQGRWAEAAASYSSAWEACGRRSLEVLTALAGALVADGREAAALEAIKAAQSDGSSGIGSTELQLLAAKTYAQWRGHVPDALLVYDALIEVCGVCGGVGGGGFSMRERPSKPFPGQTEALQACHVVDLCRTHPSDLPHPPRPVGTLTNNAVAPGRLPQLLGQGAAAAGPGTRWGRTALLLAGALPRTGAEGDGGQNNRAATAAAVRAAGIPAVAGCTSVCCQHAVQEACCGLV